jgi:hypothetical protein
MSLRGEADPSPEQTEAGRVGDARFFGPCGKRPFRPTVCREDRARFSGHPHVERSAVSPKSRSRPVATRHHCPAVFTSGLGMREGGLMVYESNLRRARRVNAIKMISALLVGVVIAGIPAWIVAQALGSLRNQQLSACGGSSSQAMLTWSTRRWCPAIRS